MESLIEVNNLSFKYENNSKNSLKGINLEINKGEVILLLGPSGSGKSTLALALNGIIPHTIPGKMNGTVSFQGQDNNQTPVYEITQKIGIVFQDPEAQFVSLNVEEELVFGMENLCYSTEEMEEKIIDSLKKVDMLDYRYRNVYSLSGGEKQKILLAALMAFRPSVFIFDEPTANLDPVGTLEFFKTVESLKKTDEHTIIIIEHKLDELIHLVDRVIVMGKEGVKLLEGTPYEVFGENSDLLIKNGIWIPQTALLAHKLVQNNIKLNNIPLSIDEAYNSFKKFKPLGNGLKRENCTELTHHSSPVLDIRDLSFAYDDKEVLKNLSLKVHKGDFLAIIGANGAGKTTLAKNIVNIIHPPSGKVFVEGKDVLKIPTEELCHKVGYVFQNPEHQFIKNTVEEQLTFGLQSRGFPSEKIVNWLDSTLEKFKIKQYAKSSPYMLSHGQKRLLSVATMLTLGQDILILDEPTFGQDLKSSNELLTFLKTLNELGKTIIIITHDMNIVAKHAQNVLVMAEGEAIFNGSTHKLFKNNSILKKARLTIPPLLQLSVNLSQYYEGWNGMATVEEYVNALKPLKQN
ncbi:ABC transporter ATP-binding protein [Methanobacterium petrolearium]|uniref:ABC transporter ATP-binding protein n=2 Tax=Methanobacterium petrolearium TaxID=710190 RepID=UPI001AEAFC9E|nr:energy-coupling factor transporter ATPase [Methanobacterium petrolearium]MBP1946230.1 energy-coupling factor transport system ATP-binding protein [Methanobacterium petrolearium]